MGPAISSAEAILPRGIDFRICSLYFLSANTPAHMSVSTHPGETQFTMILLGANSRANDFVRAIMPPFEAA
jgi:hypothetical protein